MKTAMHHLQHRVRRQSSHVAGRLRRMHRCLHGACVVHRVHRPCRRAVGRHARERGDVPVEELVSALKRELEAWRVAVRGQDEDVLAVEVRLDQPVTEELIHREKGVRER